MTERSIDRESTSRQSRPRRASASPRILELAKRYELASQEQISNHSSGSRTRRASVGVTARSERAEPTVRMGLGEMNWNKVKRAGAQDQQDLKERNAAERSSGMLKIENPLRPSPASPVLPSLRKVDAHPVHPLGNLAFDLGRQSRKRVDGLPNTGGSAMHAFPTADEEDEKLLPPSRLSHHESISPRPSIADDGVEKGQAESFAADDEQRPLVGEHNVDYDRPPASGSTSTQSALLKPYPAHEVFARNAYPLHLPHLDDYLASNAIFAPPRFSNAEALCSEEEKELYGYNLARSSGRGMEVCGAQIKVPVEVFESTHQQIRKRQKVERQEPLEEPLEDTEDYELAMLTKGNGPHSPAVVNFKEEECMPTSPQRRPHYNRGYSGATSSTMSTASHPKSRLDKFPPLMLLEQGSLDELKSNAVGPRKPPGGFLGFIPGVGSILGTIVDFIIGVEGSTLAAGIFRLQLFIDFIQLTNLNLYLVKPNAASTNIVNKVLLSSLPSLLALDLVSVFGYAVIILMVWIGIVAIILLSFLRMTRMYNPNRLIEGYNSQPWLFRPFRRDKLHKRASSSSPSMNPAAKTPSWRSTPWTKVQNVLIVMSLSVLYIPLGKLAFDAIVWNVDYWPLDAQSKAVGADISPHPGNANMWRDPLDFCYTTTMRRDEFNW